MFTVINGILNYLNVSTTLPQVGMALPKEGFLIAASLLNQYAFFIGQ